MHIPPVLMSIVSIVSSLFDGTALRVYRSCVPATPTPARASTRSARSLNSASTRRQTPHCELMLRGTGMSLQGMRALRSTSRL
jgi:hypothetical protein